MRWFAAMMMFWVAGCAGAQVSTPQPDVETLYPQSTPRGQFKDRQAVMHKIILTTEPTDEFVIATISTMNAAGKPRPWTYDVFLTPKLTDPGAWYMDYVFYDSQDRVLYAVRRLRDR